MIYIFKKQQDWLSSYNDRLTDGTENFKSFKRRDGYIRFVRALAQREIVVT